MTLRSFINPLGHSRHQYPPGTVLFESSTPQTVILPIKRGRLGVKLVGGRGGHGGSFPAGGYAWGGGGGASGSYQDVEKKINAQDVKIVVGAAGQPDGAYASNGGTGTYSGVEDIPDTQMIAPGGEGGINGNPYGDPRGGFPVPNIISNVDVINADVIGIQGNRGGLATTGASGPSVYPPYGGDGDANGYAKITYLGLM